MQPMFPTTDAANIHKQRLIIIGIIHFGLSIALLAC